MRHVISVKVGNRAGVLARVAGLFSARGYNIDSLAVSATEHEDTSIMTIVVKGDDKIIEQVKKQLNKLIDIIKITDHSILPSIQRELAIIKTNALSSKKSEIIHLSELFNAEMIDITNKTITLALMGDPEKLDKFIELLTPYTIRELIRTGRVSILKG